MKCGEKPYNFRNCGKSRVTSKNCPTRKFLVSNAAFLREYFGKVIQLLALSYCMARYVVSTGGTRGGRKSRSASENCSARKFSVSTTAFLGGYFGEVIRLFLVDCYDAYVYFCYFIVCGFLLYCRCYLPDTGDRKGVFRWS